MKHLAVPTVNVYIVKGNKVLLGRRANTGWMDGSLCPPGGHIEQGETPTRAIIREIREELGAVVDSKDLEFSCVAVRSQTTSEHIAFEFVIRDSAYTFTNAEPEKCVELIYVDMDNLPEDMIDDFRLIIVEGIIGGSQYLEIGF